MERNSEVSVPVVTISVDDVDLTLEKISKEGGSIAKAKKEFGKRGYTAHFKVTEGNVMGLW